MKENLKIVVIENSLHDYDEIIETIEELQAHSYFPSDENTFDDLRSMYPSVLEIGRSKDRQQIVSLEIRSMLDAYIDGQEPEKVLFICDYELFPKKREVNGIEFFKKFIDQNVVAIFVSRTDDQEIVQEIESFVATLRDGVFISKRDQKFKTKLRHEIDFFLG